MTETAPHPFQPRTIKGLNTVGIITLIQKEIGRFLNVYMQTIIAPMVTLLLFFAIFSLAMGGGHKDVMGVPYMYFLAPGLLMMTMIQNSFANSSSSLVIAKVQGNIVDVLMPPLSSAEILFGYIVGSLIRAFVLGLIGTAILAFVLNVPVARLDLIIVFGLLGNGLMGALGVIAGLWSEKFDHMAAVTNFIVTPLTFLSGTFYALADLPEAWQKLALANPFFYMIDGFRAGFIGVPETDLVAGFIILLFANIILLGLAWWMLRTGYKIKS